jgi:hypothetical protein
MSRLGHFDFPRTLLEGKGRKKLFTTLQLRQCFPDDVNVTCSQKQKCRPERQTLV